MQSWVLWLVPAVIATLLPVNNARCDAVNSLGPMPGLFLPRCTPFSESPRGFRARQACQSEDVYEIQLPSKHEGFEAFENSDMRAKSSDPVGPQFRLRGGRVCIPPHLHSWSCWLVVWS
jgi:hypothetical protein